MLNMFHRRRGKGFTLVELIVVIIIIGILAALAVVTYQAVINRSADNKEYVAQQSVARETAALLAFRDGLTPGEALELAIGDLPAAYTPGEFAALNELGNGWETVREGQGYEPAYMRAVWDYDEESLWWTTLSQRGTELVCELGLNGHVPEQPCAQGVYAANGPQNGPGDPTDSPFLTTAVPRGVVPDGEYGPSIVVIPNNTDEPADSVYIYWAPPADDTDVVGYRMTVTADEPGNPVLRVEDTPGGSLTFWDSARPGITLPAGTLEHEVSTSTFTGFDDICVTVQSVNGDGVTSNATDPGCIPIDGSGAGGIIPDAPGGLTHIDNSEYDSDLNEWVYDHFWSGTGTGLSPQLYDMFSPVQTRYSGHGDDLGSDKFYASGAWSLLDVEHMAIVWLETPDTVDYTISGYEVRAVRREAGQSELIYTTLTTGSDPETLIGFNPWLTALPGDALGHLIHIDNLTIEENWCFSVRSHTTDNQVSVWTDESCHVLDPMGMMQT